MIRLKKLKNAKSIGGVSRLRGRYYSTAAKARVQKKKSQQPILTHTKKIIEELEKLQGYIHDFNVENETTKKELNNTTDERKKLVEEARQFRVVCKFCKLKNSDLEQYTQRNIIWIIGLRENKILKGWTHNQRGRHTIKQCRCATLSVRHRLPSFDPPGCSIFFYLQNEKNHRFWFRFRCLPPDWESETGV